jgi:uncharacterized protein (UPF0335 family)
MTCGNCIDAQVVDELELESKLMRARMERLEAENKTLQDQVDTLLLVTKASEEDRVRIMQSIWKGTIEKNG